MGKKKSNGCFSFESSEKVPSWIWLILVVLLITGSSFVFSGQIVDPTTPIMSWDANTQDASQFTVYGSLAWDDVGGVTWARFTGPTGESGRACFGYNFEASPAVVFKASMEFMLNTLPTAEWGTYILLRVTNVDLYGTGSDIANFWVQNTGGSYRWRLGEGYYVDSAIETDRPFRVDLTLRVGGGDGEAILKIDGVERIHSTGLTNNPAPVVNSIMFGNVWGEAGGIVSIQDITLTGDLPEYYTISGVVKDSGTSALLEGVTVTAGGVNDMTGADGAFILPDIPQGVYNVKAIKVGYVTTFVEVDVTAGDVTGVEVLMASESSVGQGTATWDIRGICTFPHWYSYDTSAYDTALSDITTAFGDRVNTIDVRLFYSFDPLDSNQVRYDDWDGRCTYDRISSAIQKIHTHGFKARVGIMNVNWGGTGNPVITDIYAWFNSYSDLVVSYAEFAEARNVEILVIGWEMNFVDERLIDDTLTTQWNTLIQRVRAVFSGLVTFEDNYPWQQVHIDRMMNVPWWNNLDYIAFSHYARLSASNPDPTLNELVQAYSNAPDGGWNYLQVYQQIGQQYNKKIELNTGFPSRDGACINPWASIPGAPADWAEQALCWEAFYYAWRDCTFICGVDMEHWGVENPSAGDATSSFRGKLAEASIYSGLGMVMGEGPSQPPSLNYVHPRFTASANTTNTQLFETGYPYLTFTYQSARSPNVILSLSFDLTAKTFSITVNGTAGSTGEFLLNCKTQGEPTNVTGAYFLYDPQTTLLKLQVVFQSEATVVVSWETLQDPDPPDPGETIGLQQDTTDMGTEGLIGFPDDLSAFQTIMVFGFVGVVVWYLLQKKSSR